MWHIFVSRGQFGSRIWEGAADSWNAAKKLMRSRMDCERVAMATCGILYPVHFWLSQEETGATVFMGISGD